MTLKKDIRTLKGNEFKTLGKTKIANKYVEVNVQEDGEFEILQGTGKNRLNWKFYSEVNDFINNIIEDNRTRGHHMDFKGLSTNDIRDVKDYVKLKTKQYTKKK